MRIIPTIDNDFIVHATRDDLNVIQRAMQQSEEPVAIRLREQIDDALIRSEK